MLFYFAVEMVVVTGGVGVVIGSDKMMQVGRSPRNEGVSSGPFDFEAVVLGPDMLFIDLDVLIGLGVVCIVDRLVG